MKRYLVFLTVLVLVGAALFAGGKKEVEYSAAAVQADPTQMEAPMLAERVRRGDLPPVEQRLPVNPQVIQTVEQLGVYGGTVRTLSNETQLWGDGELLVSREGPLRISEGAERSEPNVIESFWYSDDATVFTFKLREGLRWSDGYELTSDDVMFWWNDVVLNTDLSPTVPIRLRVDGKPAEVRAIDKYTVEMRFAGPHPTLVDDFSFWGGFGYISHWHKEYLGQFHPAYTSEAELNRKVREAGFENWWQLFTASRWNQRGYHTRLNPTEIPSLASHVVTRVDANLVTLERNPYYWKVDEAGRQLPYIDRIIVERVEDSQIMTAKRIAGDADIGARGFPLSDYSLALANAEANNYRVLLWEVPYSTVLLYQFNQTFSEDLVLRDIFRDVRFRKAMSLALNREQISEIVYAGQARPVQQTINPDVGGIYYVPEYSQVYIEYDPAEANRLLDDMGLRKNAQGVRMRPDGRPLQILLEYYNVETPKREITEIAKSNWADVGVQVDSREITGTMVTEKAVGNTMQMGLWHGNRSSAHNFRVYPFWTVPDLGWEKTWAPLWGVWRQTDGAQGEEPPEIIKYAMEAFNNLQRSLDEQEQIKWAHELLRLQAENLWTIGTVAGAPQPVIVRNNIRNVPEKGFLGWDVQQMDVYNPSQFFVMPD